MELAKLPNELLIEIFTLVGISELVVAMANGIKLYDEAAVNLLPAARVSRHFYKIIVPLLYQNVQIDITKHPEADSLAESREPVKQPLRTLFTRLSTSRSVRALIRNLHVRPQGEIEADALERLQSWIPEFSQLNWFYWDDESCMRGLSDVDDFYMRNELLHILGRHWPKVHLELRMAMSRQCRKREWKVLKQAPDMLRSLKVCMSDGILNPEVKERLFWALRNIPGLQSLTTYDHAINKNLFCRHRRHWYPVVPPRCHVKLESPLPQLVELYIADDTFTAGDLLEWGAQKGWARLEKVTLRVGHLLRAFHGCERSLRSIALIDARDDYEEALKEICLRTTRLTELKIKTAKSGLPFSALGVCGHSLKTLAVHPYRDYAHPWQYMGDISFEFLQAVQRLCPKLTNLSSSIRWPLDNLASPWPFANVELTLIISSLRFISALFASSLTSRTLHYVS